MVAIGGSAADWYRSLLDNVSAMIWMTGPDKKRVYFNESWLEFTGDTLEEAMAGDWKKEIHSDDLPRFISDFNAAFDKRKLFQLEYRLHRHDGTFRWMLSRGKAFYSPAKEFLGYLCTCTEIHDEKLAQEKLEEDMAQRTQELRDANASLKRSNDELQQFAYVASHDLQEPLRKIITFVDRLNRKLDGLEPDTKAFMERITDASRRMSVLIDDLLNFSRTALPGERTTTVDLNEIVKEVLLDFDLRIQESGAKIEIAKLPTLCGVPVQMKQLFHNLISNALKFIPADTRPLVRISSCVLSPEEAANFKGLHAPQESVEIVVSDNGIGFPVEFAEKIFHIFQRLHPKGEYPGTGIGLALCRKIVENHGGIIFAKSTEQGAQFHIILPVEK